MANQEHLDILNQGAAVWNQWRREHSEIIPDLSDAQLSGWDLKYIQLYRTELSGADLSRVDLFSADFDGAYLIRADLSDSRLSGARLRNAYLARADLSRASLSGADFTGANVAETSFHQAVISATTFVGLDLSEAKGLEAADYRGPSEISISTIYQSEGKLPEIFLRGCGVPEALIIQIPELVTALQPIQFYSCFISYSSKDQRFAEQLYTDLQNKGVRTWYAPKDLKIGERIRVGIDKSIRVHDKLMLILSKNSIDSEWVEKEVETAMERERQQKRTILFPIRLDDTVLNVESGWAADIRRSRNIGDFRGWKSLDAYSKAFERLLRDLKAEA